MRISGRSWRSLIKIGIVAAVSVLLFTIIMNAAVNPVAGETETYTADFTDVSGLRPNGDVRVRGVQVGKVENIDIVQEDDRTIARVRFTSTVDHPVTTATTLAVKYQNLTGVRYVDMVSPDGGAPTDTVPLDRTTPSFDLTTLFNGLQPVLATMNTDEINEISQNALTLLQGDGGGLAPMLDSLQKLGDYATDRQQVISTLVANLARISDSLGGKSDAIIDILHSLEVPVDAAIAVLDEFVGTSVLGPQFLGPIASILRTLGLEKGQDFNKMISDAFGTVGSFSQALQVLPGTLSILDSPRVGIGGASNMQCSNGPADLPADVTLLLNGSGVTVCRL